MQARLVCWALLATNFAWAGDTAWKKFEDVDGLALYESEIPGRDLVAFKGVGEVDAPLPKVAAVLLDDERAPQWVDQLESRRIVKWLTPTDYLDYAHVGTPFVLKDRDFLTQVHLEVDTARKRLVIRGHSTVDASVPEGDYVRGEVIQSTFILEPREGGRKTFVSSEIHVDPKGSVPKWIVNLFQRSWPRKTFEGLRKQLQRQDLGDLPAFREIFGELRSF